jgi:hypothetical protein
MTWRNTNLLLVAGLAFWVLAGAWGGGWAWRLRSAAWREQLVLAKRNAEFAALARERPAPTEDNQRTIEDNLAVAEQQLAACRSALHSRWPLAEERASSRPVDTFFAIAAEVDRLRALANRQRVRVKADERFGFAGFVREGPAAREVAAVRGQAHVVGQLVEALFAARPQELLGVAREQPAASGAGPEKTVAGSSPAGRNSLATDGFSADPRLALRQPGQVDAWMFRLVFAGQTFALRAFLTSLAASPLPLLVRSVEVEPFAAGAATAGATGATLGRPAPLIAQNSSKFTVVVEFAGPAGPGRTELP